MVLPFFFCSRLLAHSKKMFVPLYLYLYTYQKKRLLLQFVIYIYILYICIHVYTISSNICIVSFEKFQYLVSLHTSLRMNDINTITHFQQNNFISFFSSFFFLLQQQRGLFCVQCCDYLVENFFFFSERSLIFIGL